MCSPSYAPTNIEGPDSVVEGSVTQCSPMRCAKLAQRGSEPGGTAISKDKLRSHHSLTARWFREPVGRLPARPRSLPGTDDA